MPVIIRDLDDDAAVLVMVDSNIQREELLPSERAFAYKMKLEALKHQGARSDLTSSATCGRSWTRLMNCLVKRRAKVVIKFSAISA